MLFLTPPNKGAFTPLIKTKKYFNKTRILVTMNEEDAIKLLKKYSKDVDSFEAVLAHSKAVQKNALEIADKITKITINKEFIKIASILHDIGRFNHPPWSDTVIQHGVEGEAIMRKEGFPEIARVCARHAGGAGISKEEIIKNKFSMPAKDYFPETPEEKIIALADVTTANTEKTTIKVAVERYKKEVSEKLAKRIQKLYDEVESWK